MVVVAVVLCIDLYLQSIHKEIYIMSTNTTFREGFNQYPYYFMDHHIRKMVNDSYGDDIFLINASNFLKAHADEIASEKRKFRVRHDSELSDLLEERRWKNRAEYENYIRLVADYVDDVLYELYS